MKDFIKKYEVWIFLVLGPILNVFFVLARKQGLMSTSIYTTGRFCFLLFMLICLLKFTRGNKGIINLFKPMMHWKLNPKWYLLGLVFPTTIAIIALLLKALYYDVEYSSFIDITITTFRGYVANFIWAFIGEVVWVSYCMRELSKITKPFYAGQIVGFFWTLWLIPVILLGEGIFPDVPVIPAFILRLGVAGMCALFYYRTKSSLCVLVLQYALSLTLISLPITPRNGGAPTFAAFGTIYFLMMLIIWYIDSIITKKKTKKINIELLASDK